MNKFPLFVYLVDFSLLLTLFILLFFIVFNVAIFIGI
jgi:hypothetical protein